MEFAKRLRRRRPRPGDIRHLGEVFIRINASCTISGGRSTSMVLCLTSWCRTDGMPRQRSASSSGCCRRCNPNRDDTRPRDIHHFAYSLEAGRAGRRRCGRTSMRSTQNRSMDEVAQYIHPRVVRAFGQARIAQKCEGHSGIWIAPALGRACAPMSKRPGMSERS